MAIQEEELLTVREVARRCGRAEETVRRWIWSGKLPARKLGNQLFVAKGDLKHARRMAGKRVTPGLVVPARKYTKEEMLRLMEQDRKLRREIFKEHGYFDVVEAVRRSREEH